jgi:hypothetical protein
LDGQGECHSESVALRAGGLQCSICWGLIGDVLIGQCVLMGESVLLAHLSKPGTCCMLVAGAVLDRPYQYFSETTGTAVIQSRGFIASTCSHA